MKHKAGACLIVCIWRQVFGIIFPHFPIIGTGAYFNFLLAEASEKSLGTALPLLLVQAVF